MSTRASALVLALTLGTAAAASAQEAGPIVIIDRPASGDLYLAGDEVAVRAPVDGDVVAAGRSVTLEARVTEDATLAGEHVVIEAEVGDDVRAAGRRVHLAAPVAGHVALAGETVLVDRAARVGDVAWLAGQDVVLRGAVGSLHARGETVTIAGEVDGDADVAATYIRLAPGAIVRGDLRWSAEQPPVVDGAQVGGRLVEVERARVPTAGDRVLGVLFWVVSLIIASVLLFLALPRFSAQVARTARTSPWRSVGAGLAILAGVPLVVALSFLTGVLWIVGVVLLAAYLLALSAGAILGVLATGDLALDAVRRSEAPPSRRERVVAVVLCALIVALLAPVPVVGPIVVLVLTIVGIGSTLASLWTMRRPMAGEAVRAEPLPA